MCLMTGVGSRPAFLRVVPLGFTSGSVCLIKTVTPFLLFVGCVTFTACTVEFVDSTVVLSYVILLFGIDLPLWFHLEVPTMVPHDGGKKPTPSGARSDAQSNNTRSS